VFALILVYLIVGAIFAVMKVLLLIPDQFIRFHLELHFINRCLNFCNCSHIQLVSTMPLKASM
jgi:hypothetical protein